MNVQSFGTTRILVLGLPTPQGKVTFGCRPHKGIEYIIGRGVVPPPKGCRPCKAYV